MLTAQIDRIKEDWFLFLGKLAALSTPQLGIIYGYANRREARGPVNQNVLPAGQDARPTKLIA